jgi:Zn-dependent protease
MIKLVLLAFTFLKFGKIAATGGTMALSLVVYAQIFGWTYAAGFIALLFAHEMGHYVAAGQRGLQVGAPMFIPFVGAFISLKQQPMNAETEAYVAFAGPFVGTLAAFACYFYAREADSQVWLAVSYSGFFLNFFNLLPVSPLDGGRITAVLSPRIWLLGAPFLLALLFYRPSPALFLIVIVAIPQLRAAWRYDPRAPQNNAYYKASPETRIEYGAMYFGLAALLAIMTYTVHGMIQG